MSDLLKFLRIELAACYHVMRARQLEASARRNRIEYPYTSADRKEVAKRHRKEAARIRREGGL